MPPKAKKIVPPSRYRIAIFLWSTVVSQSLRTGQKPRLAPALTVAEYACATLVTPFSPEVMLLERTNVFDQMVQLFFGQHVAEGRHRGARFDFLRIDDPLAEPLVVVFPESAHRLPVGESFQVGAEAHLVGLDGMAAD